MSPDCLRISCTTSLSFLHTPQGASSESCFTPEHSPSDYNLTTPTLTKVNTFVLLETFLLTEVLEQSLVVDGSQESLPSTDVSLAVVADLEPLLVVLQTDVRAELLDITAEPDGNIGLRLPSLEFVSPH